MLKPVPLVAAAAAAGWVAWKRRKLGKVELGFWVVVAIALVLYGTGVIHPPSAEHVIREIGTRLGKWTYLLVGILAFLETGAFVGLIAPGEAAILLGGFVAGQGRISLVVLLAIVWTAAVAGDVTSYFLGRRLGREFLLKHGERVKITHERLEKVEGFFDRFGGAAIFLGRFIGVVRAVAPFIAGSSRLPLRRFLPYDIVGAGIWGCGLVVLGYAFWQSFDQLLAFAKRGAFALGATIAVVAGIIAAVRWLREPENRRRIDAWLDEQESNSLGRAIIRPARAVGALFVRLAPGAFGLQVMTLLAVLGVGGFAFGAIGDLVSGHRSFPLDRQAFDIARPLRTGFTVDLGKFVTDLGSWPVVSGLVVAVVIWLLARRRVTEAGVLLLGSAIALVASSIGKAVVDRPRPGERLVHVTNSSFPSGHATHAVIWLALAVVLARVGPGLGGRVALLLAGFAMMVLIGLSRVFLHVHYLSDVVGGWSLGAACFALVGIVALVVDRVRQNAREAT